MRLRDIFSPIGRINRSDYTLVIIAILLLQYVAILGTAIYGSMRGLRYQDLWGISAAVNLPLIFAFYATAIKRLHDVGLSSLWVLASFIPIVNFVETLALCFIPSKTEGNRYIEIERKLRDEETKLDTTELVATEHLSDGTQKVYATRLNSPKFGWLAVLYVLILIYSMVIIVLAGLEIGIVTGMTWFGILCAFLFAALRMTLLPAIFALFYLVRELHWPIVWAVCAALPGLVLIAFGGLAAFVAQAYEKWTGKRPNEQSFLGRSFEFALRTVPAQKPKVSEAVYQTEVQTARTNLFIFNIVLLLFSLLLQSYAAKVVSPDFFKPVSDPQAFAESIVTDDSAEKNASEKKPQTQKEEQNEEKTQGLSRRDAFRAGIHD